MFEGNTTVPVIKSNPAIDEKSSVHKGLIYLMGAAAFLLLWLVAYGSNMLVYNSQLILPIFIPVLVSIPVSLLFNRIARVYPGSASIFGYVATSFLAAAITIIALVVLSNGLDSLDIGVSTALLGLFYPTVAIGFSRGLEVFIEKLGLADNGDSQIQHYDTIKSRAKLEEIVVDEMTKPEVIVTTELIDEPSGVKTTIDADEQPSRDFSKAVKTVVDKKGVTILQIDLDELALAEKPVVVAASEESDIELSVVEVTPSPVPKPRKPRTVKPKPVESDSGEAPVVLAVPAKRKPAPRKKPVVPKTDGVDS